MSVGRGRAVPWVAAWRLAVLLSLSAALGAPSFADGPETWLHVDTGSATVAVMRGKQVIARFKDISIGRGGVSRERDRGDESTPLGEFRIVKVKAKSDFHRFYIIDYPNEKRARLAFRDGEIDQATYRAIRTAVRAGHLPPQGTPLGGNIGIHGLGHADLRFHEAFNWTRGCIALTNEQIDRLARWIHIGTRVVID
ncbi:MAG: L,D-transpeptidase [Arenicellales bacterium]